MDPLLDLQAQRLLVATALTTQALRCLRGHVAANVGAEELLAMAHRLTEQIGPIQRRYGLRFEPSYPGLNAGVESASSTFDSCSLAQPLPVRKTTRGCLHRPVPWLSTPGVGGADRGACSQGMARVA